jgi:hypothetical protein
VARGRRADRAEAGEEKKLKQKIRERGLASRSLIAPMRPERFASRARAGTAWPADEAVHSVHDRYLLEVVEGLGVCPFARKSRESGNVVRELIRGGETDWTLRTAVQRVKARTLEPRVWEIIFLTFPPSGAELQFPDLRGFEAFHRLFRGGLAAESGLDRRYFSVCFHPLAGRAAVREPNPAAFVQVLRRSPDPLIQCVHVETVERVRKQAQKQALIKAKQELQRTAGGLPRGQAGMRERAVLADSALSQEIMHANFTRFCRGAGRRELDQAFDEVARLREALYVPRTSN